MAEGLVPGSAAGSPKRATVIGAGFSGLVSAYFLARAGYAVEVFERASRPGGLIDTVETPHGIAESGANAFLRTPRIERLFADLGVVPLASRRESRKRFVFRDGRPRRWPLGAAGTLGVFGFFLRFLFARAGLRPRAGESISEWGRRALGGEATDFLLLPALQGIYAGDGARLSATLIVGRFFEPRDPASRARGSVSARRGMGEVIGALRAKLETRGVRFHFGREVPDVRGGEGLTVVCASARDAATALEAADPELAALLRRIEMLPIATTTVFYPSSRGIRAGFGTLFPIREGFANLGVLYNTSIFEGRGRLRSETWIAGGARAPEGGMTEAGLLQAIAADRKRLHRREETPLGATTWIRPAALPHYTVELERLLPEIRRLLAAPARRNLRLVGNYLGGIGLSRIVDLAAELEKGKTP